MSTDEAQNVSSTDEAQNVFMQLIYLFILNLKSFSTSGLARRKSQKAKEGEPEFQGQVRGARMSHVLCETGQEMGDTHRAELP